MQFTILVPANLTNVSFYWTEERITVRFDPIRIRRSIIVDRQIIHALADCCPGITVIGITGTDLQQYSEAVIEHMSYEDLVKIANEFSCTKRKTPAELERAQFDSWYEGVYGDKA